MKDFPVQRPVYGTCSLNNTVNVFLSYLVSIPAVVSHSDDTSGINAFNLRTANSGDYSRNLTARHKLRTIYGGGDSTHRRLYIDNNTIPESGGRSFSHPILFGYAPGSAILTQALPADTR